MDKLKKLKDDLLTNKYTEVYHEEEFTNNAPHRFEVRSAIEPNIVIYNPNLDDFIVLNEIKFQEGPIKEAGVNGIMNEDLISIVKCRLEHFNQTEFRCKENSMAITKLEEALLWLRKRTMGREGRGIEGTHEV